MSNDRWGFTKYTLMERVDEVEKVLADGFYQSALALALTLPDICGKILFPEEGSVGARYRKWFDQYVSQKFMPNCQPKSVDPSKRIMDGAIAYQLRCAYLHSGESDDDEMRKRVKNNIKQTDDGCFEAAYQFILTLDQEGITVESDCGTQMPKRQYTVYINVKRLYERLCAATRTCVDRLSNTEIDEHSFILYSHVQW